MTTLVGNRTRSKNERIGGIYFFHILNLNVPPFAAKRQISVDVSLSTKQLNYSNTDSILKGDDEVLCNGGIR